MKLDNTSLEHLLMSRDNSQLSYVVHNQQDHHLAYLSMYIILSLYLNWLVFCLPNTESLVFRQYLAKPFFLIAGIHNLFLIYIKKGA